MNSYVLGVCAPGADDVLQRLCELPPDAGTLGRTTLGWRSRAAVGSRGADGRERRRGLGRRRGALGGGVVWANAARPSSCAAIPATACVWWSPPYHASARVRLLYAPSISPSVVMRASAAARPPAGAPPAGGCDRDARSVSTRDPSR